MKEVGALVFGGFGAISLMCTLLAIIEKKRFMRYIRLCDISVNVFN